MTLFMNKIPAVLFNHIYNPSCNTFSDHFKRLYFHLQERNNRTSEDSTIIEKYWYEHMLLDDLVYETDDNYETVRSDKYEYTHN